MPRFFIAFFLLFPSLVFSQGDQTDNSLLNGNYFTFKAANGYYGIMRSDSTIAISAQYAHIQEIAEGIIVVKQNKNTSYERSYSSGFLNKRLKTILPCNYRNITSSGNGLLIACQNSDFNYGLVDTMGRILIPFQYQDLGSFGEGLFPAKKNDLYGYLNMSGKVIIPFSFKYAATFSEGKAGASKKDVYGYIDKRGHFVIPEKYTSVGSFKNGFATVTIFDMSTIIDEKGETLFPYLFETIEVLNDRLFLFKAPELYRDTLDSIVLRDINWIQNSAFSYTNPNKTIESDTLIPFEFETNADFQGVISVERKLIGGSSFKTVQYLGEKNNQLYFSVQSKREIDEKDNWNFAVMNDQGVILTPYEYFDIKMENETIIGEKEEELENIFYKIGPSGTATRMR